MALQLGGLVSGFDTESLISTIIAHYSKPLDIMQSKKDRLETAQNAWKDVNTRLSNLRNTVQSLKNSSTFTSRVTSSSEEKVLTASAGSSSATGTYQLMVKQMASYHRYATAAAVAITGNESADANTALSLSGSFTIRASDSTNTASITVESSDTLRNISSKINEANAGVTASIVEGRLVIKSDTMGEKGTILLNGESDFRNLNLTDPDNEILDKLILGQKTAAQDAEIEYDGIDFTRGSNSISDIINGVTLNITGTSDSYVYLTVSADTGKAAEAITAFVDQYNSLMSFIEETTYVAALSTLTTRRKNDEIDYSPYDSSRTRGTLQGDTTIIRLEAQLRQMVSRSVKGFSPLLNSLSALGVTTSYYGDGKKQSGYLTINESKLSAALADPISSAAVTGRNNLSAQYSSYNSLSAAVITGNKDATASKALGLAGWFAINNTGGDTPVKLTEIKIEATDSLTTIKNKINNEGAGVTASISSDNQLVITSNTMGLPGQLELVKIKDDNSVSNYATAIQGLTSSVTAVVNMKGTESVTVTEGTTAEQLTATTGRIIGSLNGTSLSYTVKDSNGISKTTEKLVNGDVLVVTDGTDTIEYTVIVGKDAFDSLAFSQRSTVSETNYALQAGQSGTIVLEIDGNNYTVQLKGAEKNGTSSPMTTQEVLNQINRVIGTVGTASLDSTNKLVITSRSSGVDSTVKIKEIREEHTGDLAQLGLVQGAGSRGKDLDAFFTGETAPTQGTITSLKPLENENTRPGTLVLLIDSKEVTINFNTVYNNREDLVKYLNNALEDVGQAYLDENNYLVIRSLSTGESSSVRVMRVDGGLAALNLKVGQYGVGEDEINGLAILLDNFYESWVKSGGILSQKSSYLTSQMNDIQKQMDALTARIDMRVEYLWKQFSNMESKLSQLSTQSQWLELQLANLTSSNSSSSKS